MNHRDCSKIFLSLFCTGLAGCLTGVKQDRSVQETFEFSALNGPGTLTGYYEHIGGDLSIYKNGSLDGECISGRFEVADVRSGKVDKYAPLHGKKVIVHGDIQEPISKFENEDDTMTTYWNVQNFCFGDHVIIVTHIVPVETEE